MDSHFSFFCSTVHVAQTAASTWVFDLASAEARLNLGFDSIWNRRLAVDLDIASDILTVVPKAIAEWYRIFALLQPDPHLYI